MTKQLHVNPYAAPPPSPTVDSQARVSVLKCFGIVVAAGAAFGLAGALLGLLLGTVIPGYYRAVFGGVSDPNFIPWQVGLGLGLTQGIVCGIFIGTVVVVAVAWYESRRVKQN